MPRKHRTALIGCGGRAPAHIEDYQLLELYEEFGKWEIVTPMGIESGDFGGWDGWRRNNQRAQANFHQAMFDWQSDDTKRPGTHLAASLHEWEVVLALYQSALERRPVSLSGFSPPEDLISRLKDSLIHED